MWGNIQTFQEANLGNRPGVFKGREKGVTDAQAGYDRWWFEAIRGNLDEVIVNNRAEGVIHVWNVDEIEKHKKLTEFTKSPKRTNLVYKNRHVEKNLFNLYNSQNIYGENYGYHQRCRKNGRRIDHHSIPRYQ
ncbi:hypothetical protein [Aggregatibacter actinomycetemcomitans]|uniref:hypothetical protein n=1 Tax=Aggregatibacter actinomycetemcomitans TaxID=714 RepID=UPI002151FBF0|nr:hypothetical protein [Aggregatibacter actinomycetemcomitans]